MDFRYLKRSRPCLLSRFKLFILDMFQKNFSAIHGKKNSASALTARSGRHQGKLLDSDVEGLMSRVITNLKYSSKGKSSNPVSVESSDHTSDLELPEEDMENQEDGNFSLQLSEDDEVNNNSSVDNLNLRPVVIGKDLIIGNGSKKYFTY